MDNDQDQEEVFEESSEDEETSEPFKDEETSEAIEDDLIVPGTTRPVTSYVAVGAVLVVIIGAFLLLSGNGADDADAPRVGTSSVAASFIEDAGSENPSREPDGDGVGGRVTGSDAVSDAPGTDGSTAEQVEDGSIAEQVEDGSIAEEEQPSRSDRSDRPRRRGTKARKIYRSPGF